MNDSSEEYDEVASSNLTYNKADGQSPGEMLREARAAHDYSVDDVCAQTKLSTKTVHALEDNDFAALSQPVFARGYYRQCAKVLNIDSDRLMAAYTAWGGESAPRTASPTAVSVVPEDVTPSGRRSFVLVGGLLLLLVAIGAVFLLMPDANLPDQNSGDSNNTVVLSDNDATGSGASSAPDANDDSGMGTPDVAGHQDQPRDTGQGADTAGPADGDTSQDAVSGQRSGGRNVNDTLGRNENGTDAASEPAAPAVPQVEPNHLALQFTARSWVDVRDADGARLLTGIYESGETREFDGTPPYKITLGRANAVGITIGGDTVNVAAQAASNGTARLTVNAASN